MILQGCPKLRQADWVFIPVIYMSYGIQDTCGNTKAGVPGELKVPQRGLTSGSYLPTIFPAARWNKSFSL